MSDTDPSTIIEVKALPPGQVAKLVRVDAAALTDVGKVRPNNEDQFLLARFDRTMRTLCTSVRPGMLPEESTESAFGMLVADGMGGQAAGEVASETAVVALIDMVLRTPDWIMRLDDALTQQVLERMEERLQETNRIVKERAQEEPGLAGMGTTMTLVASVGLNAVIAHVGDSRAYLMRQGELHQLTKDHTFAQAMVDSGAMAPAQATTSRFRHVLTNVIGKSGDGFRVELHELHLEHGDQLLLCTDGLTEMLMDATIAAILSEAETATDACRALVSKTLEAGAEDNVTVLVARYRLPAESER